MPDEGGISLENFSWDRKVYQTAGAFNCDAKTIEISMSADPAKSYTVLRSLLENWSPVFKQMFASGSDKEVTLHNDVDDLEDFLWFIHVHPLNFAKYRFNCQREERFGRALGIASIANFYDATPITEWAITELLEHIDACATSKNLPKLHRLAEDCRDISPKFYISVRAAWKSWIASTSDPVATLCAAKEVGDRYLQGYVYYQIFNSTICHIGDDQRLTVLDRLRLLVGGMNLCRCKQRSFNYATCSTCDLVLYCKRCLRNGSSTPKCPCGLDWFCRFCRTFREPKAIIASTVQTKDPIHGSLKVPTSLQDTSDDLSLWEMFTRSPMGVILDDDAVELSDSALMLPRTGSNSK